MTVIRRLWLIAFAFAAPPLATGIIYVATHALLRATHRVIDPQIVWYAAMIELPVFFLFAVLEAKSRW